MQDVEDTHRFPCAVCGAELRFDPATAGLTCDHCGAQKEITHSPWDASAITEIDFDDARRRIVPDSALEEVRVTRCENCGAQVEFQSQEHAAECPFCATPLVVDTGTSRIIKPQGVLPFALTEQQARDAMKRWLGRLWFAPNGLKQYARSGRRMQGIYVPYWTFDADTETDYRGQRGTNYTTTQRVRVMEGGKAKMVNRSVTKIRWKPVRGHVARFFNDVLVLASRSLPKRHTDALAPWDLSAMTPYDPQYLAGFRAEAYVVELDDAFTEARSIMDEQIDWDIKHDIGGDHQRISSKETTVRDVTFKHVLLPVWLAAYRYRGKSYRFVVNARTGTVEGERPYSAIKIAFAVLLALLVGGIVAYFVAQGQ